MSKSEKFFILNLELNTFELLQILKRSDISKVVVLLVFKR